MKNPDIPNNLSKDCLCCEKLFSALTEGKLALSFDNAIRELQIFNKHYQWVQRLDYCPFCGVQQPKSLADEWEKQLTDLLGEDFSNEDIPEQFHSDLWWRGKF